MLRITKELVSRGFQARHQLEEVLSQIVLMKSYATLRGKPLPTELGKKIADLAELTQGPEGAKGNAEELRMNPAKTAEALGLAFEVHGILSGLVHPATPESIEASAPRSGIARIQWPRITDMLIAVTFFAVAAFAVGTAWNAVRPNPYLVQLSYLGAALLGASFSGLYTAYTYISDRTFDPARGNSYMTRVVLGAVSGLILANFGIALIGPGTNNKALEALAPAALALIGGYSADAVNLILKRVADTLVATVRGSADEALKAKQAQLEAESKAAELQHRQTTIAALSEILTSVTDSDIKSKVQALMASVGQVVSSVPEKPILDMTKIKEPSVAQPPPTNGKEAIVTDEVQPQVRTPAGSA